ncbi:MAG: hypothetical protein H8E41_09230 [Desulfobulbaceae bacterium]|uniref:Doubled CXXCH motif domain-containing protein n=1 Tax=Candidatus Desulfobia pelagia TaxID=2841692 RepID=A0A8J6NEI1_9BACT|nr:hypothetical protein [Candidatus Desulfobia pelagia]
MKYFIFLFAALFVCGPLSAIAFPVHDTTDVRCLDCHVSLPFEGVVLSFHEDIPDTCTRCHDDFPCSAHSVGGEFLHPVGVKPTMVIPKDMVLDVNGKVSCITCHVFHEGKKAKEDMNSFYLRRPPGMRFCYACHRKL